MQIALEQKLDGRPYPSYGIKPVTAFLYTSALCLKAAFNL